MTDGIIQQHLKHHFNIFVNKWQYCDEDMIQDLIDMEQELIEKIKQEIDNTEPYDEYNDGIRVGINTLVIKLIGDNKE